MNKDVHDIFSERLHEARTSLGWSMAFLARRSGVERSLIGKIENKTFNNCTITTVWDLASALQVPPSYLLGVNF